MKYRSTFLATSGLTSTAVLEAPDEQALHEQLHREGCTLLNAVPVGQAEVASHDLRFTTKQLLSFTQSLYAAMDALKLLEIFNPGTILQNRGRNMAQGNFAPSFAHSFNCCNSSLLAAFIIIGCNMSHHFGIGSQACDICGKYRHTRFIRFLDNCTNRARVTRA